MREGTDAGSRPVMRTCSELNRFGSACYAMCFASARRAVVALLEIEEDGPRDGQRTVARVGGEQECGENAKLERDMAVFFAHRHTPAHRRPRLRKCAGRGCQDS